MRFQILQSQKSSFCNNANNFDGEKCGYHFPPHVLLEVP
jgi:hypothetical protein